MTRNHRLAHRALWPILAIVIAVGFSLALAWRPPPAPSTPPAAEQPR